MVERVCGHRVITSIRDIPAMRFLDRIRQSPEFIQFLAEMKAENDRYRHEFSDERSPAPAGVATASRHVGQGSAREPSGALKRCPDRPQRHHDDRR